jgi:hypothetical protein
MSYSARAAALARLHVDYNYVGGKLRLKAPPPGVPESSTEEHIAALERSMSPRAPTIPDAFRARLAEEERGPGAGPGGPGPTRFLGEPIVQVTATGPIGVADEFYTVARHTAWANLESVTIHLTAELLANYLGSIGLWLVPEFLEGDPVDDPRDRPDCIHLTPPYDAFRTPQLSVRLLDGESYNTTIHFDRGIPWVPYSLVILFATESIADLVYGYVVTKFSPTLPADPTVRIPTSPVVINRTTITATLNQPAPPAQYSSMILPETQPIPRRVTVPQAAPSGASLPRAVIIKVLQANREIFRRTIAWPSLDPNLKREALNSIVTGKWPITMEPLW